MIASLSKFELLLVNVHGKCSVQRFISKDSFKVSFAFTALFLLRFQAARISVNLIFRSS